MANEWSTSMRKELNRGECRKIGEKWKRQNGERKIDKREKKNTGRERRSQEGKKKTKWKAKRMENLQKIFEGPFKVDLNKLIKFWLSWRNLLGATFDETAWIFKYELKCFLKNVSFNPLIYVYKIML